MTRRELKANSTPAHLSGYQLMWMLVTFDLPVETPAQRKAATKFRNDLLDLGFEMSQFSNYLRFCNGKEQYESYVRRIGSLLPEFGDVFIFQFTDRQYENIVRFSDQHRRANQKNPDQMALF
jgi:CRISPR-associated protein Cas2